MRDPKKLHEMSDQERREAVLDYGKKLDQKFGTKIRAARDWLFRIIGGLLLLIGLILLLLGNVNGGTGLVGGGLMIFGMGLKNISLKVHRVTIGIGVIFLGTAFLNFGFGQIKKAGESATWPSVSGKIVRSELEKRTSTEGTGNNKRKVTYHAAVIEYTYCVEDTPYNSYRVAFGGQDRSHSSELVSTYPKDKSVDVFYNPENPEEAVLEPGRNKNGYFFPVFGGFIALTGLLLAYKGLRG